MKVKGLVVYRASPSEKAELVKLVRTHRPEITTLSIGDGANDVNMITEAHVGVGLKGIEGKINKMNIIIFYLKILNI